MEINNLLEGMSGKVVNVERHGPHAKVGKLLEYNTEFLTLHSEDEGIIYYNTNHIKSLSSQSKETSEDESEESEEVKFLSAPSLRDLLSQMQYSWVSINGGPEKVEGVLNEVQDDLVTLVVGDEVVHLPLFHVKTITNGVKKDKNNENKEKNNNEENKKNDNDNKSDNNKNKENKKEGKNKEKNNDKKSKKNQKNNGKNKNGKK